VLLPARPSVRLELTAKRLLDVVCAGLGMLITSPLLAAIALLIKATSPGPIFYRWKVVGRQGRPFTGYKFRTMVANADALKAQLEASNEMSGPVFKLRHDPRITPLGRRLRRYSLDELPQLWSVLKGDMSLVGPRPALFNQDDLVALRTAAGVDALRPGLTGWAQINGRDELPIPQKAALDREYLERMSLAFDLRILLTTARAALSGRGVTH
jgi:O-antigen biosynthesis protein WbqP